MDSRQKFIDIDLKLEDCFPDATLLTSLLTFDWSDRNSLARHVRAQFAV